MEPEKIKEIRDVLGLSQAEIATLFNISLQSVSRWERGAVLITTVVAAAYSYMDFLTTSSMSTISKKRKAEMKKQKMKLTGLLADQLKDHRETLGLSQVELAQLLGVHSVTVSRWETGAVDISCMPLIMFAMGQVARLKNNPKVENEIRRNIEQQMKVAA